jgi:hypothetical protein
MVVAELAIGALGEFINSGLKRAVSAPFQKVARLEKVDHAARLRSSTDPLVAVALDDYIRVLGSYQGKYTVTVDAFLKELEASGVVELMVENALIGRASSEVEKRFIFLHNHVFGGSEDGNELYASMMAAFTASMRASANDPLIFSLARSMQQEVRERLDEVDRCLNSVERRVSAGHKLDDEQLVENLQKIAKGLQQSYRNIRIETNRGPKNVEINRIYVPAKLSFRENKATDRRITEMTKVVQQVSTGTRRSRDLAYSGNIAELKVASYTEFSDMFRRAVVLGDPGGGKSTLCQKYCYDTARHLSLHLSYGDSSASTPAQRRLPIRVILRKFEQARDKEPQLDLLTYIVRDTINICGGSPADIRLTLEHYLSIGKVVMAFDGLDEILDTSMREDYCDLVVAFCNQYPLCPTIVTSRFVGYDDARLTDDFEEMVLEKFDETEIALYVNKFMTVVGGQSKGAASDASARFAEQTKNAGADLRRNPLMLGLMGWLFLNNDDIPSNRPEIYKECATLMFERWDQRRGIIADDMNEFDRSQLFIHLASQIYGQPSLAGGVNKEWLNASLKTVFFRLYESNAKSFQASKLFVKFITGRAWIMSEIGEGVYAFTHQTFLEYFFAKHLEDEYDSVSLLLKALKPRIVKSEWNEVSHLALQIKTHGSIRKQEEALNTLSSYLATARSVKQKQALLTFSGRSLEYFSPPEARVGSFLNELYFHVFERVAEGDGAALSLFGVLANASPERRNYIRIKVADALKHRLLIEDSGKAFDNIVRYLSRCSSQTNGLTYDGHSLYLPSSMQRMILSSLRDTIIQRSSTSQSYKVLAWVWYGYYPREDDISDIVKLMYENATIGTLGGFDGLTNLVITISHIRLSDDGVERLSKDAARDIIRLLGSRVSELLPINPKTLSWKGGIGYIPLDFWKQVLNNNDEFSVCIGIVLIAVLQANAAYLNRRSSVDNRTVVYAWALAWLRKPANAKRPAAIQLADLIVSETIVAETDRFRLSDKVTT